MPNGDRYTDEHQSLEAVRPVRTDVPLVSVEGITKRFGSIAANRDVSFNVPAGGVTALVGENGAGKSTAMNILSGLYLPDEGRILIDGRPLELGSPRSSIEAGVGMVHQQFRLVATLTGFENISLAVHAGRFFQPAAAMPEIEALLEELGFEIDLSAHVWQMTPAARQQLEIIRTLAVGARILVLDEPTSVLSPVESGQLFRIVRQIAASGRSVVLISHKVSEILEVADDIVVMRGGHVVHKGAAGDTDARSLARLIVGEREIRAGRRPPGPFGEPVLRVTGLDVLNDLGLAAARDITFEIRAGELVVIVGVTGNGQIELLDAIGGMRPYASGNIEAPADSRHRGFAYIPVQHLGVALVPALSVEDNALLGHHRKPPFGWWLSRATVRGHARKVVESFGVTGNLRAPVRHLSGGNLQRIVLGRELLSDPALIVASYPARGLDVASAAQVRDVLVKAATRGAAVLISSEELSESLEIATRVLVMNGGRIVAECDPTTVNSDELGDLMTLRRTA